MRFRSVSKLTMLLLAVIVLATCITFGAVRQTAFAKPSSCSTASAVCGTQPKPAGSPVGSSPLKGLPGLSVPGVTNANFSYAGGLQYFTADGASGNFNQPKPTLSPADAHTLAELAVESTDGKQVVEVGWNVDQAVNKDTDPHLFVFHWVNGKPTCYNTCGFVQVSKTFAPGDKVTVDSNPGATHQYAIKFFSGDWWIWYETQWIGYFPGSLWKNSFTQVDITQWFGEVSTFQPFPCSQMGDGLYGNNQSSAVINTMYFFVNGTSVNANEQENQTNLQYYTVGHFQPNSFTYGGPGSPKQCMRRGNLDWKYRAGGIVGSTPTVASGVVYVGSDDYSIHALNAITGAFIWRYQTGFYVTSTPTVASGVVYVGSDDTYVYALNASNGKLKWKYQTSSFVESTPAVASGVVYISSDDGYVYALNASTGALLWHTYTSSGVSSPAVASGVVYVGSNYDYVDALSASDGTILWHFQTGGVVSSSPVVVNGVIYVGCDDFHVYAINASTGTLDWSYATGGYSISSSAAVANGVVYIGDAGGHLYALTASKGTLIWRYQSQVDIISSPTVVNGAVYLGLEDVYAFNATTGTLIWRYGTGQGFSTPMVASGVVYAGSFDSYLYALYA